MAFGINSNFIMQIFNVLYGLDKVNFKHVTASRYVFIPNMRGKLTDVANIQMLHTIV